MVDKMKQFMELEEVSASTIQCTVCPLFLTSSLLWRNDQCISHKLHQSTNLLRCYVVWTGLYNCIRYSLAMDQEAIPITSPSLFNWTLGFILVGIAWGFTNPFIRKAAVDFHPPPRPFLSDSGTSWARRKLLTSFYSVLDLVRSPGYAIPLLLNLTGSVWFFLLVGQAGE